MNNNIYCLIDENAKTGSYSIFLLPKCNLINAYNNILK